MSLFGSTIFTANICPLFYVETLADLDKFNLANGRALERYVGIIAEKSTSALARLDDRHNDLLLDYDIEAMRQTFARS